MKKYNIIRCTFGWWVLIPKKYIHKNITQKKADSILMNLNKSIDVLEFGDIYHKSVEVGSSDDYLTSDSE